MAFAGQIILSSSPSRAATPLRGSITPISSSPLLPSPSQLFAAKIATKTDERRGGGSSNGFIWGDVSETAAIVSVPALDRLREGVNSIGEEPVDMGCVGGAKRKNARPKKSQAKKEEDATLPKKLAAPKIATRKPRSKFGVTAESSESPNQTGVSEKQAVEKKGIKKDKAKSQSKIRGSRITKPGVTCVTLAKNGKSASSITKPAGEEPLELLLAEAVRRRRAWTPPKDTPLEAPNLEKLGRELDETLALETQEPRKPTSGEFENLLGDFGYDDKGEGSFISSDRGRNANGEAVTKRRKLELVNLAPSVPAAQSRKRKLPKKKPQTVTGKATAQFLTVEPGTPSLLQYLETEVPDGKQLTHIEDPETQVSTSKAVRRKSKPKTLTQSSSAKSKIKSRPSPVLHSPKTAMKSANEQDLIFGTSSQLAREESPTCLRDIQQAIINSQQISEEISMFSTGNITPSISCNLPERAGVTPLAGSKNLWSVASRGLDGSLLTVEVIDLVDTPRLLKKKPSTSISKPSMMSNIEDAKGCAAEAGPSLVLPSSVDMLQTSKRPLQSKQNGFALEQPIPRSLAEASLQNRRHSRSPVKKQKIPKDSGVPPPDPVVKEMPNYQGFTTADLCKEIASFGFKAIKKRNEMIALLERCWESQARIALQTLQPNLNAVNPVASRTNEDQLTQSKPSKRKGKLQEPTTAEATSNVIPSPPKPRGRPRKAPPSPPHPPPPEPLLASCLAPPIPCTSSSSKTDIHTQITNAINAAPATHSVTHLTFRERILLYDPIVLEDLIAWLNTEGLGMVGIDEEVGIGVVKEWCERESVCCHSRNEGWIARK